MESNYESGYFKDRILSYISDYHQDLLTKSDFRQQLNSLADRAIDLYLMYDQMGLSDQESTQQALSEVLQSITSPFGTLREFILDEMPEVISSQQKSKVDLTPIVRYLLPIVGQNLQSFIDSNESEKPTKAALLKKSIISTLFKKTPSTLN